MAKIKISTIKVRIITKEKLRKRGQKGESFDKIITKMIKNSRI